MVDYGVDMPTAAERVRQILAARRQEIEEKRATERRLSEQAARAAQVKFTEQRSRQSEHDEQEAQVVRDYIEACCTVLRNSGIVGELETVRDVIRGAGEGVVLDNSSSMFLVPDHIRRRILYSDTLHRDCVSLFWVRPSTTSEEVIRGGYLSEIPGDDDSFGGEVWVPEWKERVSFPSAEKVGILVRAFAAGHVPDSLSADWVLDALEKRRLVTKDDNGVFVKEDLLVIGKLKNDAGLNNLFDNSYFGFAWPCKLKEVPKELPRLISEAILKTFPADIS